MQFSPEEIRINGWSSKRQGGWSLSSPKGVQVIHLPTGICIEIESERTQHQNRYLALKELQRQLNEIES